MTRDASVKHFRQIVRRRQIANKWKTIFLRQDRQRRLARHQHHRRADIAWRVENVRVAAFQQLQQPRVLLSAAATEADDVNLLRLDFLGGGRKTVFVNRPAIRVVARRRIRLVQREPFLRLLDAVVMELVVHAPRAERCEQVAPDSVGELAFVNCDAGGGGHSEPPHVGCYGSVCGNIW